MNFHKIIRQTGVALALVYLLVTSKAQTTETAPPTPPAPVLPKQRTFLRIINAARPQIDPVWRSGLDLKMGEEVLAKDIRSGEGGGYTEIKGPLKGSIKILRNATGRTLLSQESELKKNTFNTVIIYGSLGEDKSALQMLFHIVEKETMENPGLSLLNCIDFFDVSVSVGNGNPSRVYPLVEWQKIGSSNEIKSLVMSFEDEKKRKTEFTQQLIMEPAQEYWILLTPNPHPKAFHRPRVTLIQESKARAEALEPPVEEPKPDP